MPHSVPTLDAQVEAYIDQGLPSLAGLADDAFRGLAAPFATVSQGLDAVLVVTRELVDPELRVPLLRLQGSTRDGILDKNHFSDAVRGLAPYRPRDGVELPAGIMYLIFGFERGDEFRNVAPRDALPAIAERGRSPLTIDEGLSLATVMPGVLEKNHCFMLAGSTRGDKRVPALWIAERAPKLGWCFDGVPHTWLGVASAERRIGIPHDAGPS